MPPSLSEKDSPRHFDVDADEEAARAALLDLPPTRSLMLVGEDPAALLDELEEEEPGRFEWSHLEAGEEGARLEVRRRESAAPRTVTDFLQADHRRLDAIVPVVERLTGEGAFDEARARFSEFACGLGWHIDVEEQVLFPFFEAKTGMTRGPTTVMRQEHVAIRAGMQRVLATLEAKDEAATHGAIAELTGVLSVHNMKEERMLYPMTDRAIESVEAQERLVRRIAKF